MNYLRLKKLILSLMLVFVLLPLLAKGKSPFVDIIKQNRDGVVQIKVKGNAPNNNSPFTRNDEFFKFFFPEQPQHRPYTSLGSGFIFRFEQKTGETYILTNNHVVESGVNGKITVTLADKISFQAEIVGLDPATDLAVIKITVPKNETITVIDLGNSNELEIGEWAIAIGNPFGDAGLDRTVTVGVVSAKGRAGMNFGANSPSFQDYIQTDAAINPGNSGGPLLDIDGKVIGINAAITTTSGGNMGIGFAIPIDLAKKVANNLIDDGYVKRAFLGIIPQEITEDIRISFDLTEMSGVLVAKVEDDSPAAAAKLKDGDIIKELNGSKIYNIHKFRTDIAHLPINSPVEITVLRAGKRIVLVATLEEHPSFIKEKNKVASAPQLGINVVELDSDFASNFANEIGYGVVVKSINRDSEVSASSLQSGDVILEVNNTKITTTEQFYAVINSSLDSNLALKKILLRVAVKNENNFIKYVAINIKE